MVTYCQSCLQTKGYCKTCTSIWYLEQPLTIPEAYSGHAVCDYEGKLVHVLQIGLGTFGTFLHGDADWMDVLLEASSRRPGDILKGIGVDPFEESVGPLEQLAIAEKQHSVSIMLAAVGEESGDVKLFCLPYKVRLKMRQELEHKMPQDYLTRGRVDRNLAFLENMSSIGSPHHDMYATIAETYHLSQTNLELMEVRDVRLVTYADIIQKRNCPGCEVLIIDAEGSDCAILRSMIHTCTTRADAIWPWVIRFETLGHADFKERNRMEESTVEDLQSHGYLLVDVYWDATLVYGRPLCARLARWADKHFRLKCITCGSTFYPSSGTFAEDVGKGYSQWGPQGWCCSECCWAQ